MSRNFKCKCCGAIRLVSATSKYTGVDKYKASDSFRARISINGSQIYIGSFKSEEEAALAYDKYVLENKIIGRQLNNALDKIFEQYNNESISRNEQLNAS